MLAVEQVVLDTISIAQHVLEAEERTYAPLLGPHYPQQVWAEGNKVQVFTHTVFVQYVLLVFFIFDAEQLLGSGKLVTEI